MSRKPSWVNPNPDPRNQPGSNYDNHIWYTSTGKVIGHANTEDSPLTRLGSKSNRRPIVKRDRSAYNINPDWTNIHHTSDTVRRNNSLPQTRLAGGMSAVRKNAYNKLRKNG